MLSPEAKMQMFEKSERSSDEIPLVLTRMMVVIGPGRGVEYECRTPFANIWGHPDSPEGCPGCGGIRARGLCVEDSKWSTSGFLGRTLRESRECAKDLTDQSLPKILRGLHPHVDLAKSLIRTTVHAEERERGAIMWTELRTELRQADVSKLVDLRQFSVDVVWARLRDMEERMAVASSGETASTFVVHDPAPV